MTRFNEHPYFVKFYQWQMLKTATDPREKDTSDRWVLTLLSRVRVYVAQHTSVLVGLSSYLDHRHDSAQQTTHRTTSAIKVAKVSASVRTPWLLWTRCCPTPTCMSEGVR